MKFPAFKFIDVAFNNVRNRNHVIELSKLRLPDDPVDCFATYARYDSRYLEHWVRNNHRVGGFQGPCYSDCIPIDIDRSNLEASLNVARDFVHYLEAEYEVPIDAPGIFFSSWKGFHILIPVELVGCVQPCTDLPKRFKQFVKSLGDWGFDLQIY